MTTINIGTKFINKRSKRKDVETVVDIHTTKNMNGEHIKTIYICEHDFMGQPLRRECLQSTIALSQIVYQPQ